MGGTHYQDATGKCPHCGGTIQHWDLFGMLPGLVYAATKYIIRHRGKDGKQGLEKAKHYIDKIIEQEYPASDSVIAQVVRRAVGTTPHTATSEDVTGMSQAARHVLSFSGQQGIGSRITMAEDASERREGSSQPQTQGYPPVVVVWDLDKEANDARAATERAYAYAAGKHAEEVPEGWILETCSYTAAGEYPWHYRPSSGGAWSPAYARRSDALAALLAEHAARTNNR